MARRKNTVEEIDETPVENAEIANPTESETVQTPEEETEALDSVEKPNEAPKEKPKKAPKEKPKKAPKQEIPENVLDTLKIFSNYPELLVTPQGCVFAPGCKLDAAKAAILYKNPFYNT